MDPEQTQNTPGVVDMRQTATPSEVTSPATPVVTPPVDGEHSTAATPAVPDAAAIAAELAKLNPPQEPQAPAPVQLTDAEIQEKLKVWTPDEQYVNQFQHAMVSEDATPEQRQAAFVGMRDGMMTQVMTAVDLLLNDKMQGMQQQVAPMQSYVQQQQQEAAWGDFQTGYPALKEQRALVDMVAEQMSAAPGFRPSSKDEFFKSVATTVEGMLKQSNPQFTLGTPTAAAQPTAGMPPMATTQMPAASAPAAPAANGLVPDVW